MSKRVVVLYVILFFHVLFLVIMVAAKCHGQDKSYAKVEDAVHYIHIQDVYNLESKSHCSATAIAPHALLTAGHCLDNSNLVVVDGKKARIGAEINDGYDHAILLLFDCDFKKFAQITQRDLIPSEDVFIVGNPAYLKHQYRRGVVSGTFDFDNPKFDVGEKTVRLAYSLDINAFFGDSGAAVFDSAGHVVGAVSERVTLSVDSHSDPDDFMIMMATMKLSFTKEQLALAEDFGK